LPLDLPPATRRPPRAGPGGGGAAAAARPDTGKPELPWKPWKDVTKDTRVVSGLFTAYLKRENVYLALKPEQFDRDYLMVTELSEGIGTFLDAGTDLRSDLIRFHRAGDHVQLWVVNPYATATPNTPAARIVAYSFGQSVAQSFPIASIRDTTNEVLIDLAPFVGSDFADLGPLFQLIPELYQPRGGTSFDRERSSFQSLRMFPTNTEIEARLTFRTSGYLGIETLADYRYIPL